MAERHWTALSGIGVRLLVIIAANFADGVRIGAVICDGSSLQCRRSICSAAYSFGGFPALLSVQ